MGSDVRHVRGEAQKELVKKFEVFTSKGRSRWQVWSDWITISAIAVSNATDKSHFDEREQQYMTIVKKYTKQEVDAFADMFSILVMALEDNSEQDFLGELYMCLGLGSDHAGQFFTPYHLCEFMSAVTTPAEEFQQKIGDRGWVAVCDPTCGAGALLVVFANECRKKEINYQTDVLFVAQDIDYIVGMMCYLQMSLLGMPGYVVIGDMSKEIKQQRMNARDEASQLFCWCIVTAMNQKEGIGAERLRRACNEMQAFQARYKSKIDSGNRRTATEAMRDDLREICDFTVRLPQNRAPRNHREEQLRMAQDEGAEIAWLVISGEYGTISVPKRCSRSLDL